METNQNKSANILFGNPLMYRYARSLFRPEKVGVFFACYIIALILFFGILGHSEEIYYFLMGAEFIALWIIAPHISGSTIGQEIAGKNIDFFRMLPLSSHQKIVGITIGRNQLVLIFAGINLAIALAASLTSEISFDYIMNHLIILFCGSFFLVNLSTTSSLKFVKRTESKGSAQTILIALLAFWGMGAALSPFTTKDIYVDFYFFNLHILKVISIFCVYLGCINYHCSLRLIARENSPTLSPLASVCWAVGLYIIVFGLYLPYAKADKFTHGMTIGMYCCVAFIAAYLFVLALKTFDHYWQYSGSLMEKTYSQKLVRVISNSNMAMYFLIFLIGILPALAIAIYGGISGSIAIQLLVLMFLTCLFPVLLAEICTLLMPKYSKIGFVLVAVYIAYLIWPHIFITNIDTNSTAGVSVFGMLDYISGRDYRSYSGYFISYTIYHTIINGIVAVTIFGKFRDIVYARTNQQ